MLPDSRFIKRTTLAATLIRDEQFLEGGAKMIAIHSSLEECVRQNRQKETKVTELEKQKPHLFSTEAGLLLFEGRVYIPPDPKIWQEVLHDTHDAPVAGHPGIFKMNKLI
jgi:hypothetical protein